MPEYAEDCVRLTGQIEPFRSQIFLFGPVTSGLLQVFVRASDIIYSRRINLSRTPSQPVPNILAARRSPTEPIDRLSIMDIFSPGDIEPGVDDQPDIPPNPLEAQIELELLDADDNSIAFSTAGLRFEIPDNLVNLNDNRQWKLKATNKNNRPINIAVFIYFPGRRIILEKEINLDFLNEKLDLIINESQPFFVEIYNKTETVGAGRASRTTTTTLARFKATEDWETRWPFLKNIEYPLGIRILAGNESVKTEHIKIKATIHDEKLAFKISFKFFDNIGKFDIKSVADSLFTLSFSMDLVKSAFIGFLPELLTFFNDFQVSLVGGTSDTFQAEIYQLSVDVFLVLEPEDGCRIAPRHRLKTFGIPEVKTNKTEFNLLIGGALSALLQQIPFLMGDGIFWHDFITNILTWLLGDKNRQLAGSKQQLHIKYAGDDPRLIPPIQLETVNWPTLSQGNLVNIDHIIVLMMENRSFDHMLGYLSLPTSHPNGLVGKGRQDIVGLSPGLDNPSDLQGNRREIFPLLSPRNFVERLFYSKTRGTRIVYDPDHSNEGMRRQRGDDPIELPADIDHPGSFPEELYPVVPTNFITVGQNEGYVLDFAKRLLEKYNIKTFNRILRGEIMGYHPAEHVPVYDFFAENFLICNMWFCSHPGETWPNRFVTLTGNLAPLENNLNNPELETFDPLEVNTIFDHLTNAGVSWRYYEHDFSMIRLFSKYTFDQEHVKSIHDANDDFFARVAAGNLPSVTFIDPDISDLPPGNDDHPPADIAKGQEFIKNIYDALVAGPFEQWKKTLFVIVYDEHGGFYDHVFPEPQQIFDPNSPITNGGFVPLNGNKDGQQVQIDHYGGRVPAIVISPLVNPGSSSDILFDHTSILKTIIRRFLTNNPPQIGQRVARANDLEPLLVRDPNSIQNPNPSPPITVQPHSDLVAEMLVPPSPEDFRGFLSGFKKKLRR